MDPRFLELELTETFLLENPQANGPVLRALKDTGAQLALGDFGTGYSSLGCLKRFQIDTLKIDQSFVRDLAKDRDNAGIVSAVIAIGRSLQKRVVAEGVETREQLAFLRKENCPAGRGFFPARRCRQRIWWSCWAADGVSHQPAASRASSLPCMPPNPPLLITSSVVARPRVAARSHRSAGRDRSRPGPIAQRRQRRRPRPSPGWPRSRTRGRLRSRLAGSRAFIVPSFIVFDRGSSDGDDALAADVAPQRIERCGDRRRMVREIVVDGDAVDACRATRAAGLDAAKRRQRGEALRDRHAGVPWRPRSPTSALS